ncbi:hypothetical protein BDV19DRAFT_341721 [Aspergillus venezuelensis]
MLSYIYLAHWLTMDFLTVFFVLPTASSYSTRINIFFFYMTWTTLVMSHSALRLELYGTLLARLVFYILPSLLFLAFDLAAPGTASSFKERGESGLPTGSARSKPTLKELKIAGWSLLNVTLSLTAQLLIETLFLKTNLKPAVQMSLSIPMPWNITKQLFWGFLLREALSYTIHRFILHSRLPVFSFIANLHKTWYHSLQHTGPFPLTAHYDHPLAYMLLGFIPMYLPVLFMRFHMITFLVYTVLISIEECFAFSGYYVLPSFVLSATARRMEGHLVGGGKGIFGRWGLIDLVVGTGGDGGGGAGGSGYGDANGRNGSVKRR